MEVDPKRLAELTAQFEALNLPPSILDPEEAALDELESGEPILATYSFLKWLTDAMVKPGDSRWMDVVAENSGMMEYKVLASVLKRLLDAGADRNDLNTLVRIMQYDICNHICYMLDQVAMEGILPIQDFGLYVMGDGDDPSTDKPIVRIEDLHKQICGWHPLIFGE
jgi:hypothetical protein